MEIRDIVKTVMNESLRSEVINAEEMKQLTALLQKLLKVAAGAYSDGDYTKEEWNKLRGAIYTIDDFYGYKEESLSEDYGRDYEEADVFIDEIYRKIVRTADSVKNTLITKSRRREPDDASRALEELSNLVDQDVEDLYESINQRLD